MLPTDWARPSGGVMSRVRDSRAEQYWDPDHRFAKEFGKRMDSDPQHPQPHCCEDGGIPWDLVAIYPAQSRWDGSLPRAVFVDGPVVEVKQQFRTALVATLRENAQKSQ